MVIGFVIVHAGNVKKEKVQMCRHEGECDDDKKGWLLHLVLTLILILKKISAVFSTLLIDLSSLVSCQTLQINQLRGGLGRC